MVSKEGIVSKSIDMGNIVSFLPSEKISTVFYLFRNQGRKHWLIPQKNMKIGLSIYQPTTLKGKALKEIFPIFKNIKFVQRIAGATVLNCALDSGLLLLLVQIFKTSELEFSFFFGTPSVHQKLTIQIFKGNEILGYCKVSKSAEIKSLFKNEYHLINNLRNLGISNIPIGLYCGALDEEFDLFIQGTTKSSLSKNVHSWSTAHWTFLTNLKEKTIHYIPFEQSDFYKSISDLPSRLENIDNIEIQAILLTVRNEVLCFFSGRQVEFSVYHGDLTPWNCYLEHGELFVFDFEYAKNTYPPNLDWFHFFTQVALFKYKADASKILKMYEKERADLVHIIDTPDFMFKCYLLDIISFYLDRDKANMGEDVRKNMIIWIELLGRL